MRSPSTHAANTLPLFATFLAFGVVSSAWLARMPAIRGAFSLSEGELGGLLTIMAIGSFVAVLASGTIVSAFGTTSTLRFASVLLGIAMTVLAMALTWQLPALLMASVGLVGVAGPLVNVPLNVAASDAERAVGRAILPQFHGAYSIGAVAGSGLASIAAQFGVSLATQSLVVGILTSVAMFALTGRATTQPDRAAVAPAVRMAPDELVAAVQDSPAQPRRAAMSAAIQVWREPRTIMIGVMMLFGSLSEGTATAWLAIVIVSGIGASEPTGALAVSIFTAAMMVGRFVGPSVIDRLGRPRTTIVVGSLSIIGLLVVILGGSMLAIMAGVTCWGLGAALLGPLAIAAAADEPEGAAARVSVVSSVGAVGQLVAPPMLGRVAALVGPRAMLWVVVAAIAATIALAPVVRHRD